MFIILEFQTSLCSCAYLSYECLNLSFPSVTCCLSALISTVSQLTLFRFLFFFSPRIFSGSDLHLYTTLFICFPSRLYFLKQPSFRCSFVSRCDPFSMNPHLPIFLLSSILLRHSFCNVHFLSSLPISSFQSHLIAMKASRYYLLFRGCITAGHASTASRSRRLRCR